MITQMRLAVHDSDATKLIGSHLSIDADQLMTPTGPGTWARAAIGAGDGAAPKLLRPKPDVRDDERGDPLRRRKVQHGQRARNFTVGSHGDDRGTIRPQHGTAE